MPKALEQKLEHEAEKKGYHGKRKNRYVYGTLNKIEANKAGGPEKVFKNMSVLKASPFKHLTGDYRPIHPHVTGVHIGVVIVVGILIYTFFIRKGDGIGFSTLHMSSTPSPAQVNPNVPTQPVTTFGAGADALTWKNLQYNAFGAYSGALNGEAT